MNKGNIPLLIKGKRQQHFFKDGVIIGVLLTLVWWNSSSCFWQFSRSWIREFWTRKSGSRVRTKKTHTKTHVEHVRLCSIHFFCGALTTVMWASASWRYEHRSCLILQGSHAFFQMELQSFIGLGEQTIHSVWQTLVVLLIHFLSLTSLMSREEENQTVRGMSASNFLFDTDSIWVFLKSWSSVSAWI